MHFDVNYLELEEKLSVINNVIKNLEFINEDILNLEKRYEYLSGYYVEQLKIKLLLKKVQIKNLISNYTELKKYIRNYINELSIIDKGINNHLNLDVNNLEYKLNFVLLSIKNQNDEIEYLDEIGTNLKRFKNQKTIFINEISKIKNNLKKMIIFEEKNRNFSFDYHNVNKVKEEHIYLQYNLDKKKVSEIEKNNIKNIVNEINKSENVLLNFNVLHSQMGNNIFKDKNKIDYIINNKSERINYFTTNLDLELLREIAENDVYKWFQKDGKFSYSEYINSRLKLKTTYNVDIEIDEEFTMNTVSGMQSAVIKVTKNGVTEILICYPGSQSIANDWIKTNIIGNIFDDIPIQYQQAHALAGKVKRKYGNYNIVTVGHSLGGALAEFSGASINTSSFTIDSAPVKTKDFFANYDKQMHVIPKEAILNNVIEKNGIYESEFKINNKSSFKFDDEANTHVHINENNYNSINENNIFFGSHYSGKLDEELDNSYVKQKEKKKIKNDN